MAKVAGAGPCFASAVPLSPMEVLRAMALFFSAALLLAVALTLTPVTGSEAAVGGPSSGDAAMCSFRPY